MHQEDQEPRIQEQMAHSFREIWYLQGRRERMLCHRRQEESALRNYHLGQTLRQRRRPSREEACALAAALWALRMSSLPQALRQRLQRHQQLRHGPRRKEARWTLRNSLWRQALR